MTSNTFCGDPGTQQTPAPDLSSFRADLEEHSDALSSKLIALCWSQDSVKHGQILTCSWFSRFFLVFVLVFSCKIPPTSGFVCLCALQTFFKCTVQCSTCLQHSRTRWEGDRPCYCAALCPQYAKLLLAFVSPKLVLLTPLHEMCSCDSRNLTRQSVKMFLRFYSQRQTKSNKYNTRSQMDSNDFRNFMGCLTPKPPHSQGSSLFGESTRLGSKLRDTESKHNATGMQPMQH